MIQREFRNQERGFSLDRLTRLSRIERRHFWFVGRRAQVERLLGKYLSGSCRFVLDLGCGTGYMLQVLARRGYNVVGLDLRPEGLEATRQALPQARLLRAQATWMPLGDNVFDAVIVLDVLEHVDDQVLAAEIHRVLRPGGYAIITVPAMPWLWSYRDEVAGHLRRYTRPQLARVLAEARLYVQEMRYYQSLFLPLVVITRWFGRTSRRMSELEERPHPILNSFMAFMNRIEAKLGDYISLPWGSSLIVACRKLP
jgi:SAM-dependent methyltransferase